MDFTTQGNCYPTIQSGPGGTEGEDFPDTESVNAALRAYREIRQLVSTTRG